MTSFEVWKTAMTDYGKGKRFETQGKLAEACHTTQSKISRWSAGKDTQNIQFALDAADNLGCTLLAPNQGLDDFFLVPKVEAKCGAGASLITSGDVMGMHAFRKSFFGRCNIHPRTAVMMDVIGDSMEPTIYEGDTVLFDQSDNELRDGYIYVLTLGEELRIKRLQRGLSEVKLISDNKKYDTLIVSGSDLEQLKIHGRVRWIGRTV